ncbi:MAG TPA: hypothetical protein VG518_02440, partial [Solirubrobacterales bacterium]|nr:hypothetical protein [Solirubrobacterales bacterium]
NAVNAVNATTVNGHSAGCLPGTQLFAGACWQSSVSGVTTTAPNAAISCGAQGGMLPEALELIAFAQQKGVALDGGGEWSNDILSFSGPNAYAVATVFPSAVLESSLSTETKKFRCVIPLVT